MYTDGSEYSVSQNMRLRALEEENAELRRQIREYYVEPAQPRGNDGLTVRMFTMRRFLGIYLGFETQDPRFPIEPYVEGATLTEEELCGRLTAFAKVIAPASTEGAFDRLGVVLAVGSQGGYPNVIVPVAVEGGRFACAFAKAVAVRLMTTA
jgi:hypothetical protein